VIKKPKHKKGEKGRMKRKKNQHKKTIKEEELKIKILTHELSASTPTRKSARKHSSGTIKG
jgi:hypothetical protein